MSIQDDEVWLFSYGTLRQSDVQRANFGRELDGRADILPKYALSLVQITDPQVVATSGASHHPIARHTGNASDGVPGMAFRITSTELAKADAYEVSDYRRASVKLESGIEAFAYVGAEA